MTQRTTWDNPMKTQGFEFVEFASNEPEKLEKMLRGLGFIAIAEHATKPITLYRQGKTNFLVNKTPNSFAQSFIEKHGPCACGMAFRVEDAKFAYDRAISLGATAFENEYGLLAIEGIGGSALYLIDESTATNLYDNQFTPLGNHSITHIKPIGYGLGYLDHVTHNVYRGNMDKWAGFYEKLFNFREIRYFDIEGKMTGLKSRAMTSPDGNIRIPINESSDDKSQIAEYLHQYRGEGIQHIALGATNIYEAIESMREHGIPFLTTPVTYYEAVDKRIPHHGEDINRMKRNHILIDGAPTEGQGLLLQIFTKNVIGPIFFEIIQRKGNEGFGEGNFKALFIAMEEDQIRRGVL
jgi:4-hydroxyphenylpyruvate dioxygenase